VSLARHFLRATLREWDAPDTLTDSTVLVGSELVTNAVLHTGAELVLELMYDGEIIRVAVSDSSPIIPTLRVQAADSMTGRGLAMVESVASRWGVLPLSDGKTVWAEIGGARDPEEPEPAAVTYPIELLDLDLDDLEALARHHDAMTRELELLGAGAPAASPIVEMVQSSHRVAEVRTRLSQQLASMPHGATAAQIDLSTADLDLLVTWLQIMDSAEMLCRAGTLLSPPAPARLVDLRRRMVTQFQAQRRRPGSRINQSWPDTAESLSLILQTAPIGIAVCSLDTTYLRVNPAMCKLLGHTEAELLGTTAFEHTYPDDDAPSRDMIREAIETSGYVTLEKRYLRPDGTVVPAQLHIAVMRSQTGAPLSFVTQVVDLSAQRAAEAALAERALLFRLAFEESTAGMAFADEHGILLQVNPALCRLLGQTPETLIGRRLAEAASPEVAEHARETEWLERETELRFVRPDGSVGWAAVTAWDLSHGGGASGRYLIEVQDMTAARIVSDAQLGLAVEAAGMGTWEVDLTSGLTRWNPTLAHLLQLAPDAPPSVECIVAALGESDQGALRGAMEQALTSDVPVEHDFEVPLGPDGTRWILMRMRAERDAAGAARLLGVALDVTDRRQAQERITELYRSADQQRKAAQRAASRLALLQAATTRLSRSQGLAELSAAVVWEIAPLLGAVGAAMWLQGSEADQPDLVERWQWPDELSAAVSRTEADWWQMAHDGWPVRAEVDLPPSVDPAIHGPLSAHLAPLRLEGRFIGVLGLCWNGAPPDEAEQLALLAAFADQCAQALDRARLWEIERRTVRRQRFLAEASRQLAATLDVDASTARLAELCVPGLADACTVALFDGQLLLPVASAAGLDGPVGSDALDRLWSLPHVAQAIERRQPVLAYRSDDGPPATYESVLAVEAHLPTLAGLPMATSVVVPLVARGHLVGMLQVMALADRPPLDRDDQDLLLDLVGRAALAIDNARNFQLRNDVADTLQRSLLPTELPRVSGASLAACYDPAMTGVDVGGDFYDAFHTGGEWGLFLGDVCGKGPAAAALTAMVRYSIRVAAIDQRRPAAILQRVNEAMVSQAQGESFSTACYVRVVPAARGFRITVCSAGHPLPLIVRAGQVIPVGSPGGLIGLFHDIRLSEHTTELLPGDVLVLYTDGVTEAHGIAGLFGEERLEEVLLHHAGRPVEEMVQAVRGAVLSWSTGRRDDLAILAFGADPVRYESTVALSGQAPIA
jgi:PAS domain S-box-containing protein